MMLDPPIAAPAIAALDFVAEAEAEVAEALAETMEVRVTEVL